MTVFGKIIKEKEDHGKCNEQQKQQRDALRFCESGAACFYPWAAFV